MTTKSAAKSRKSATMGATFNLTVAAELPAAMSDSAILSNLLDELQGDETTELTGETFEASDSIIESAQPQIAGDPDITDLTDAVEDAERAAAKHAVYASQSSEAAGEGDDAPAPPSVELTKEEKKAAKAAAAATAKAAKAAAKGAAPKAPVVPRATSITHKPGALLMVKLGASARDYLSFSMSDVGTLDQPTLEAKQDEFIARMDDRDSIADKVKEKMSMLLTWLQKGGELNEVLKRTFTVMHTRGELTSGDKGNLQLNLLSKPYSMGTARSQANQMFMALPELGIVVKEKGRMLPNPDSVLLPMINAKLGLV